MSASRFATAKEARDAGWYSRRHQTDAEHRAARETWRATRGPAARRARALKREVVA